MEQCSFCHSISPVISATLKVCGACLREKPQETAQQAHVAAVHAATRREFGLPEKAPQAEGGKPCRLCVNECRIPPGGVGLCGLPVGHRREAVVSWYHDPLPTNCVADWVCPGGTGTGYPEFAYCNGPEHGYTNLAVFYGACTFNCLFCQNWHYRLESQRRRRTAEELAAAVHERTACICYFGGDPTPQLPHALEAARLARARHPQRPLRICWETNGSVHPAALEKMAELSLVSGGCIKFDLKAWHEATHQALCGVTNRRTLDNFARLAEFIPRRPEPPFLVASTLLVPGYVDVEEVAPLAQFIRALRPDIPYTLLAFHPDFFLSDLPPTSRAHAERCRQAALEAGLTRVRIGNVHLLSRQDYRPTDRQGAA